MSTALLIIKAVLVVLPAIIEMVREGRIRNATLEELSDAFIERQQARVDAANRATPPGLPDDPYNRDNA